MDFTGDDCLSLIIEFAFKQKQIQIAWVNKKWRSVFKTQCLKYLKDNDYEFQKYDWVFDNHQWILDEYPKQKYKRYYGNPVDFYQLLQFVKKSQQKRNPNQYIQNRCYYSKNADVTSCTNGTFSNNKIESAKYNVKELYGAKMGADIIQLSKKYPETQKNIISTSLVNPEQVEKLEKNNALILFPIRFVTKIFIKREEGNEFPEYIEFPAFRDCLYYCFTIIITLKTPKKTLMKLFLRHLDKRTKEYIDEFYFIFRILKILSMEYLLLKITYGEVEEPRTKSKNMLKEVIQIFTE